MRVLSKAFVVRTAILAVAVGVATAITVVSVMEGWHRRLYDIVMPTEPTPRGPATRVSLATGSQIVTQLYSFRADIRPICGGGRAGAVVTAGDLALCFDSDGGMHDLTTGRAVALDLPDNFTPVAEIGAGFDLAVLGLRHATLAQRGENRWRLAISYPSWDATRDCVRHTIAETDLVRDPGTPTARAAGTWRVSTPHPVCVTDPDELTEFDAGGSLAYAPDGALLVAYGWNTWSPRDVERATYVFRSTEAGWDEIARGLRNPAGLLVASDGTAWVTDHSTRGGDELNRISIGADFGWPRSSIGTDYYAQTRALQANAGRHDQDEAPIAAWVPSVAPSDLTEVTSPALSAWAGDLLVSTLGGQSILRVRLAQDRVLYTERIWIGHRLRDIAVADDGTIHALLDQGNGLLTLTPILTPPSAPAGTSSVLCSTCHADGAPEGGAAAPSLTGIIGRPVASVEGYDYSEALLNLGGVWTRQRILDYVLDPQAIAPGSFKNPMTLSYRRTRTLVWELPE